MSGGIDSTSICATVQRVLSARGSPFEIRAHTIVYDTLFRDQERHYAALAAQALGVQSCFFVADGYRPFDGWDRPEMSTPEPSDDPFFPMRHRQLQHVATHSRVLLCGEGADEIFWGSDLLDLFTRIPLTRLAADVARSLILHGRRPALGIRKKLNSRFNSRGEGPRHPTWLKQEFAECRRQLAGRQRLPINDEPRKHFVRPEAHERLSTSAWSWYCEMSDPGVTRAPVELRYPFLDVRLVTYVLSLPPVPWCIDKHLLRTAMRDVLPEPIRRRPKAPLTADPLGVHLRASGTLGGSTIDLMPELAQCVDLGRHPLITGNWHADPWVDARLLCLNRWLKRQDDLAQHKEAHDQDLCEA
jgi:asparagine synthase (glutamine-hydrolysing)